MTKNKRFTIDVSVVGGGKTSDSYAKRCREYCIHYDAVVADCYLGNNIYENCECYKPKCTGKLQNSLKVK